MPHKPDALPREPAMHRSTTHHLRHELAPPIDGTLNRRGFLRAGLAVGSGLVVAFHLPLAHGAPAAKPPFAPNAFIRIDGHGQVTLVMPQVEMGQGIYTSVAMILAEELDAAFDRVVLDARARAAQR
jgi:isoquinoline 1-oxidoreductase beta subunit